MVDDHRAGVLPRPAPALAEHRLVARVPAVLLVPAEVVGAELVAPVVVPAAERAGELAHVGLGVGPAVGAEREQLHQLAGVVLVDRALAIRGLVEHQHHRRVLRDRAHHALEVAQPVGAEQVRLVEHEPARADRLVGGREPVVEHEREPLDQLVARADHAVEPEQEVVAPLVVGRERVVAVHRRRAVHRRAAGRAGERQHGLLEAELGELGGLARARAEAGAPQQALGLRGAERPGVDRDRRLDDRRRRGGAGGTGAAGPGRGRASPAGWRRGACRRTAWAGASWACRRGASCAGASCARPRPRPTSALPASWRAACASRACSALFLLALAALGGGREVHVLLIDRRRPSG